MDSESGTKIGREILRRNNEELVYHRNIRKRNSKSSVGKQVTERC